MPSSRNKNSTAAITVACAIVFIAYVFCYLYFMQADVLALSQFAWSGGQTHYDAMIGAVLLTIVLFLIRIGVASVTRFPKRLHSLVYFPSLVLLGILTGGTMQSDGIVTVGGKIWVAVVLLLLFAVAARQLGKYRPYESPLSSTSLFSQASWMNMGLLVLMFFLCQALGNTDRLTHNRLKMERYVSKGQYDKALLIANKSQETDSLMTMLRAFSLSKQGLLGEKLFSYALCGGSRALLPAFTKTEKLAFSSDAQLWKHLGAAPREAVKDTKVFLRQLQKQKKAKPSADDYLLTAYLLDRNLTDFALVVKQCYDMRTDEEKQLAADNIEKRRKMLAKKIGEDAARDSVREVLLTPSGGIRKKMTDLPKHYREALVLYTHLHTHRVLTYHDSVIDADYEDFLRVCRAGYTSPEAKRAAMSDTYFGTYWYYYEIGQR